MSGWIGLFLTWAKFLSANSVEVGMEPAWFLCLNPLWASSWFMVIQEYDLCDPLWWGSICTMYPIASSHWPSTFLLLSKSILPSLACSAYDIWNPFLFPALLSHVHARMLNHFRHVQLFVILWITVACHTPLTLGFSRQEYWSGLPYPPPGDLPHPGIEPMSPASPAMQEDSLPTEPRGKPPASLIPNSNWAVEVSGWLRSKLGWAIRFFFLVNLIQNCCFRVF